MSNPYYNDYHKPQQRKPNYSRYPQQQQKVIPEIINIGETTTQVKSMFTQNSNLNDQIDQHRDIFSHWTESSDNNQKKQQYPYRNKRQNQNYQPDQSNQQYKKKQQYQQQIFNQQNEQIIEYRYSKKDLISLFQENKNIGELDQWVSEYPNCFTSEIIQPTNNTVLRIDPSEGIISAQSGYSQQQTVLQQQQSRNYRIAAKQKYYQQKQFGKDDDDEQVPEWYQEDENAEEMPTFELKSINIKDEIQKEKQQTEDKISTIMELLKDRNKVKQVEEKKEEEEENTKQLDTQEEYKFSSTLYYKHEDLPTKLQEKCNLNDEFDENDLFKESKEQSLKEDSLQEMFKLEDQKEQNEEKLNTSNQSMDYEDLIDDNDEKVTPLNSKPSLPAIDTQKIEPKEEPIDTNSLPIQNQNQTQEKTDMWEMIQKSEGILDSSHKDMNIQQQFEEPRVMDTQQSSANRFTSQIQQAPANINASPFQQSQQQNPFQQQQQQQSQISYMQDYIQQSQQQSQMYTSLKNEQQSQQQSQQQVQGSGQAFTNFIQTYTSCTNTDKIWFYKDPQDQVQGPFSTTDMQIWCNDQYFTGNLPIAWAQQQQFITLNQFKEKATNLIKASFQANQSIFQLLNISIQQQLQQQMARQYQQQQQQGQGQINEFKSFSPAIQKPYSTPSPSLQAIQQQQALQQLEVQKQNAQQEIMELAQKQKSLQQAIMQMQYQSMEIPKEYIITYQLCQNKLQQYQEFSKTVQYQINSIHQQLQQSLNQQQFTPPLAQQAQQYYSMKQQQQQQFSQISGQSPSLLYQQTKSPNISQMNQQSYQSQTKSPNINSMMNQQNYQNYQQLDYQQQQQQSLQFQNLSMFDNQQQQPQQQQQPSFPLAFQNLNSLKKESQGMNNQQNSFSNEQEFNYQNEQ